MKKEEKEFAEKILKHLCVGSQIDGIRFGLHNGPNSSLLYFMHYDGRDDADQLWLNFESRWTVYSKAPDTYPSSENELDIKTDEEQLKDIVDIRREKVVDIRLGDVSPHLIIVLESGKVLFVNGHHPDYECWQIGDEGDYCGKDWLIVAVPGDEIAVWAPDDFKEEDSLSQNKDKEQKKKSAIATDDFANRAFFGSPTIGGAIIVGGFILYILYDIFLK